MSMIAVEASPHPFPSSLSLVPMPRLFGAVTVPSHHTSPSGVEALTANPTSSARHPLVHATDVPPPRAQEPDATAVQRHALASRDTLPVQVSHAPLPDVHQPGVIPLAPRSRLSLARLFRLEQELSELSGGGGAVVYVEDGGQVLVSVPPAAEERAREYLILAGEITEGFMGRE